MSSESAPTPIPSDAGYATAASVHLPSTRPINEEASERKRAAIGLSARRPTAPPAVHRPPRDLFTRAQRWLVTWLLLGLLLSTALLVYAKLTDAPTSWASVQTFWRATLAGESWPDRLGSYSPGPNYQLRISDEFDTRTGLVACTQQAGEWASDIVPGQGIYRMQIWPGHLTWSTIAPNDEAPLTGAAYRVDASVTIVDMMPTGYTGFIGRYQDPANFYLFMVDGLARYQIQLWHAGVLTTLQPWTANPLLNPAGFENIIALEETGTQLQFFANGAPLATVTLPELPLGAVGLLGGAGERSMAEINVDWLRVYDPVP
jgi:hypothetical protein